jgi:hypothetical protein
VLFRAKKILKFGAPFMVVGAGWETEREYVPSATTLISNFTAVVKRKPLLSLQ